MSVNEITPPHQHPPGVVDLHREVEHRWRELASYVPGGETECFPPDETVPGLVVVSHMPGVSSPSQQPETAYYLYGNGDEAAHDDLLAQYRDTVWPLQETARELTDETGLDTAALAQQGNQIAQRQDLRTTAAFVAFRSLKRKNEFHPCIIYPSALVHQLTPDYQEEALHVWQRETATGNRARRYIERIVQNNPNQNPFAALIASLQLPKPDALAAQLQKPAMTAPVFTNPDRKRRGIKQPLRDWWARKLS